MHRTIAGAKFATEQHIISTRKICHFSTSLLHNKNASGDVPRVEIIFKKSFKPAASNVSQIDSSTSQSSDAMGFFQKFPNDIQVNFLFFKMIVRKACGEQTLLKLCNIRNGNNLTIAISMSALDGVKTFLSYNVVDDTQDNFISPRQSDADCING